jgi:hypothetical protein
MCDPEDADDIDIDIDEVVRCDIVSGYREVSRGYADLIKDYEAAIEALFD